MFKIYDSCEPVSEAVLKAFEADLGIVLPQDYRRFLSQHNGGEPNPNRFHFVDEHGANTDRVRYLLGLTNVKYRGLSEYIKVYSGRIPRNFLPIGYDSFSNLICLSLNETDYSKVYFWDHDWEVTEGEPDYSNVYLIAASFSDFLDQLFDSAQIP